MDEATAADALLLPKGSSKELLHRSSKHTGEQAIVLQLPVTTKDAAIAADVECAPPTAVLQQAAAALFYAIASLMVIFVNKVGVWVCLMLMISFDVGPGLATTLGLLLGVGVRGRAIVSWVPYAAKNLAKRCAK